MKNKFLKVITAAVCVAFCGACMLMVTGCGGNSSDGDMKLVNEGKLTVASSLDFPPFENLENGEAVGYDIAIIKAVAEKMGLEADIQNTKFDAIVAAVAGGEQFDCGISGITITPERAKEVTFSNVYYTADQAVVVLDGKYTDISELQGKKVGVQSGTTGEDYAKESVSTETVAFDEATACFAALRAGNVEAVAMDLPVVESMIKTAYDDCVIIEKYATGEEYGIAINSDNQALVDAINAALEELAKDGTLDAIAAEYLA